MALPIFQTNIREFSMMQTQWASQLNPVLGNAITNPLILKGIVLQTGTNVINHKLGQTQQGFVITDINAPITLYRSAAFNDKTLTLTSSGSATVNILVF